MLDDQPMSELAKEIYGRLSESLNNRESHRQFVSTNSEGLVGLIEFLDIQCLGFTVEIGFGKMIITLKLEGCDDD